MTDLPSQPFRVRLVLTGPGVTTRFLDGTIVPRRDIIGTSLTTMPDSPAEYVAILKELIEMLEAPTVPDNLVF